MQVDHHLFNSVVFDLSHLFSLFGMDPTVLQCLKISGSSIFIPTPRICNLYSATEKQATHKDRETHRWWSWCRGRSPLNWFLKNQSFPSPLSEKYKTHTRVWQIDRPFRFKWYRFQYRFGNSYWLTFDVMLFVESLKMHRLKRSQIYSRGSELKCQKCQRYNIVRRSGEGGSYILSKVKWVSRGHSSFPGISTILFKWSLVISLSLSFGW